VLDRGRAHQDRLGPSQIEQEVATPARRALPQRALEHWQRALGRPAADRVARRRLQLVGGPLLAGGLAPEQMGGDPLARRVRVREEPCGARVPHAPATARDVVVDGTGDEWVHERQPLARANQISRAQLVGGRRRDVDRQSGQGGGMRQRRIRSERRDRARDLRRALGDAAQPRLGETAEAR
jgi:hypothetical protein